MGRGGKRKGDLAEINDLFELTHTSWVSTPESAKRRRLIIDDNWTNNTALSKGTKDQYTSALRFWIIYADIRKASDPTFTSVLDDPMKVREFLEWRLAGIAKRNENLDQKAQFAMLNTLQQACQALNYVRKCQAGVPRQENYEALLTGPKNQAKVMEASARCNRGGVDSKVYTEAEHKRYRDACWTAGKTPEAARTGLIMVVNTLVAQQCGLRPEDSAALKQGGKHVSETVPGVGPSAMTVLQLIARRPAHKGCADGILEVFTLVENAHPESCAVLAVACDLVIQGSEYQRDFLESAAGTEESLPQRSLLGENSAYHQRLAQHTKLKQALELDKKGTGLHIDRSTGNALLTFFQVEGSMIDLWGRWSGAGSSTRQKSYSMKASLATVPAQAVLAGRGKDFRRNYFNERSSQEMDAALRERLTNQLLPHLAAAEALVSERLEEMNRLTEAEKGWGRNAGRLTALKDIASSLKADRHLVMVFLAGFPLLVDLYGADRLVVTRSSAAAQDLLRDPQYQAYADRVRAAHAEDLRRLEFSQLPVEDQHLQMLARQAAQLADSRALEAAQRAEERALQSAEQSAHYARLEVLISGQALQPSGVESSSLEPPPAMLVIEQVVAMSVPEAPPPPLPLPMATVALPAKVGAIEFKRLNTALEAFEEWPAVEKQIADFGGLDKIGDNSAKNFYKKRHLVERIRLLVSEHGLSKESACAVYQRIMDTAGFTLAELQVAVDHAECVPLDPSKKLRDARLDMALCMSRNKSKPQFTRRHILQMRDESLRVAGVLLPE